MNRTRKTMLNALFQTIAIFTQSVLALFVTRTIISNIGSDGNGVTSTASQLLIILTLIEGGFTLATLVKLYEPYNSKDYNRLNKYIALSRDKYKVIGIWYLIIGIAISLVYAPFIKTNESYLTTAVVIILSVVSSAFDIYYVCKYRLLFQVSQSEYIISIIQTITTVLMYSTEIIVVILTKSIVYARVTVTLFQLLQGISIGVTAKLKFTFLDFDVNHSDVSISGTKDVFVGKVASLLYTSAPILFISTFVSTVFTSVYSVYNYVFGIISNAINAVLVAPRNALGQLLNSEDRTRLREIFNLYEFVATISISILYSVTYALIIPFVRLYTSDIADVNYIDFNIAILLVLNAVFQMIHIPSGTCIEISGRFRVTKIIQTAGAATITITAIIGAITLGIYGILAAKLITSIVLAVAEIGYVRRCIIPRSLSDFFHVTSPSLLVGSCISIIEAQYLGQVQLSVIAFLIYGALLLMMNTALILCINVLLNREYIIIVFKKMGASLG